MVLAVEQNRTTQEIFRDALNLFVGERKRYSVEAIAAATGQQVRTVKAHLYGETCPGLVALLAYMAVLPEEFANMVLAPAGLSGVSRMDDDPVCGRQILSAVLKRGHQLATAYEDGRIDHREARQLAPEFEALGVQAIGFARDLLRGDNVR